MKMEKWKTSPFQLLHGILAIKTENGAGVCLGCFPHIAQHIVDIHNDWVDKQEAPDETV